MSRYYKIIPRYHSNCSYGGYNDNASVTRTRDCQILMDVRPPWMLLTVMDTRTRAHWRFPPSRTHTKPLGVRKWRGKNVGVLGLSAYHWFPTNSSIVVHSTRRRRRRKNGILDSLDRNDGPRRWPLRASVNITVLMLVISKIIHITTIKIKLNLK